MGKRWGVALVLVVFDRSFTPLSPSFSPIPSRASLLIWLLTGVIGAGAALTLVVGGWRSVAELRAGGAKAAFKAVCAG